MSMDEYHRKHMPQEMIFQIGNLDNQEAGIDVDDSWCKEAIPKVVEKLESVGCKVISWDLHNDEATPHVHLRYCPIDSKGEVNISNCLYEHGVMPPDVSKLETRKNGKPKFTRYNNPKQTLLNEVRAELEELGHEWCNQRGLILDDQNRTKRKHQTVNEYKRDQLRKDVVELENTIEEQQIEVEQNQEQIDSSIEFAAQQYEAASKAQEEAALANAKVKRAKKTVEDSNTNILKANEMLSEKREEYNKLVSDITEAETTKASMIKKAQDEAEEEAKRIKKQAEVDAQEIRDNAQAEANEFLLAFDEVKESFKEFLDEGNKRELFRNPKYRAFGETMKRYLKNNVVLKFVEQLRRERVNKLDEQTQYREQVKGLGD